MEKKKHTEQFLKRRKFLMMLPLLTLPFVTMIFWVFGGSKGNSVIAEAVTKQKGLNLKLPEAKLKNDKGLNKLSFYEQATLDSEKIFKERKLDPYWNKYSLSNKGDDDPFNLRQNNFKANELTLGNLGTSLKTDGDIDSNEAKVYAKLQQLNEQLNKSSANEPPPKFDNTTNLQSLEQNYGARDIDRLEGMMRSMQHESGSDSEMNQLNIILDKILAIQHPETTLDTTRKSIQDETKTSNVYPVDKETNVSITESLSDEHNSFYSLDDTINNITDQKNIIKATIPETQTLMTGSTVKLLLSNGITAKGITIPENTYVYGTASLNNERLRITVTSIRYQDNILPVSLKAYDLDGLEGIYVPGSVGRDVAKQSADRAVNGIGIATLDPSIAAQATSAGIQAAKTLISKKVKQVKITVNAGYQIFLKNNNQRQ